MEPSERELRATVAVNPSNRGLDQLLAIHLVRSRQFAEGVDRLSRFVRSNPQDFDSLVWLAVAHKGLRDFKAAISNCRQAIKLRPDAAAAHHTLGQCFLAQRMTGQAIESLKKAIELDPNVAPSYHGLG